MTGELERYRPPRKYPLLYRLCVLHLCSTTEWEAIRSASMGQNQARPIRRVYTRRADTGAPGRPARRIIAGEIRP